MPPAPAGRSLRKSRPGSASAVAVSSTAPSVAASWRRQPSMPRRWISRTPSSARTGTSSKLASPASCNSRSDA